MNEPVPSTYLRSHWLQCNPGERKLTTATYFDIETFNAALPQNQTNPRAFQRIDPNIDSRLGPKVARTYSTISDDDYFSARWTGKINLACSGVYEFQSNGNIDNGGRMWIDGTRVIGVWVKAALSGGDAYFDAGAHDFKFDWYEERTPQPPRDSCGERRAIAGLADDPDIGLHAGRGHEPNQWLRRDGGDNGNNSSYWVWQTPTALSPVPVDVTADQPEHWGLGSAVMMVPSFSPDGSKLVFIDGDSGGGAGWRKRPEYLGLR